MKASNLLLLAGILLVIWIVASLTRFIAGVALNLLLFAAIILAVVWVVKRARGGVR